MVQLLDFSLDEDTRKEYEIFLTVYGRHYSFEEVKAMDDKTLRINYYDALANYIRNK